MKYRLIQVGNLGSAMVDPEDYPILAKTHWSPCLGYAESRDGLMHRIIMGDPPGKHVHHVNGNRLDNRRENLVILGPGEHSSFHAKRRAAGVEPRKQEPAINLYDLIEKCQRGDRRARASAARLFRSMTGLAVPKTLDEMEALAERLEAMRHQGII